MKVFLKYHIKIRLTTKIIFFAVYSLVACEFFLRTFSPIALLPHGWVVTSYGLRGNEINRSYRHTSPEYTITMRTNSKGVRANRDISYEKTDSIKRIVLLGDSFAMGYGVELEDTFSSQMQKHLKENGVNAEVVNLGVPTYGNAEELIVLKEEGLKYQPDLVLLAWHPSDYPENVKSNLFGIENGQLVRKNKTYLPKAEIREFLFQFKTYCWLTENSHFYKFIRNFVYLHIRKPFAEKTKRISLAFKAIDKNSNSVPAIQEGQSKPNSSYRNELTMAILKEIKQVCILNGAQLLILDIPISLGRTKFESRLLVEEQDSMTNFDVFNPIELFKEHKGKKIYWEESEGHFTTLGCRIVGKGLAELALSRNLLNSKPTAFGMDVNH